MKRMWSRNELRKIIQETYGIDINNLIDKDGHLRFDGADGVGGTLEGLTITYCKWSLSGTHLLMVVVGQIADTTILSSGTTLAEYTLPAWIHNKIVATQTKLIEYKTIQAVSSGYSTQNISTYLNKEDDNKLSIKVTTSITLNSDKNFKVAFDLLIDND